MLLVEYYQIGGFRAHLWDYSNDALALRLMGEDGADLVLGIKPNGASYLLLPVDRFLALHLGRPRARPWRARDFESLSPIQFGSKSDLVAKLGMLASNKKATDGGPRDRSKANTEYSAGGDALSAAGIIRSSFEHQRVFYRLFQDTIHRPEDYAVTLAPWLRGVRIYSFAFNLWASDTRLFEERQAEPRILDVGWTEFAAPTDSDDLRAVSTTHLNVEEDRYLGNPGRTRLVLPDITQTMPRASISTLLQNLFATEQVGERRAPKLLLVHDEKMTRSVLRVFGVDTSQWVLGIKHLLYPSDGHSRARRDDNLDTKRESREYRAKWPRERSRSPRRRADGPSSRPRSPPVQHEPLPVYIVDVREMYQYLMQAPSLRDNTVISNARALSVRDTAFARGEDDGVIYVDINPTEWCAGRDSRLLGYLWEEMANSIAIDEQRALRQRYSREDAIDSLRTGGQEQESYEDADPNDSIQPIGRPVAPPPRTQPVVGMFDSEDEDEDW